MHLGRFLDLGKMSTYCNLHMVGRPLRSSPIRARRDLFAASDAAFMPRSTSDPAMVQGRGSLFLVP
jgi:hypothetical protein